MANLAPEANGDIIKVAPLSTTVPLEAFTVFPNLPFEIRNEIWVHAVAGSTPRIVEVILSSGNPKPICHTSSPAVLSTCHESRLASLRVFEEVRYEGHQTGAMINTDRDTLYLNTDIESGKRLSIKQEELIHKCRRLAMNRICFYGAILANNGYRRFRELNNIEELVVVIDKDAIGGHPTKRTSVHFAAPEARDDRKYVRTGDHLAYALWKLPHIQGGMLMEEVEASESRMKSGAPEVPGSVFRRPATTSIGLLTKDSTAELCAATSIGSEVMEMEIARLQRVFAVLAKTNSLAERGLETLARRSHSLSGHLLPTDQ